MIPKDASAKENKSKVKEDTVAKDTFEEELGADFTE